MKKIGLLVLLFLMVLLNACIAENNNASDIKNGEPIELKDLRSYFTGYDGCFVMFNKNSEQYIIYNEPKSKKPVPPCSTFKIINSLIGLETKVIQDENTIFQWDGTNYGIPEWNRDNTLQSAIAYSVVWYYQRLASMVGNEKMQEYLNKVNYGNKDLSGGLTQFWLQSSLTISPREQVDMLRKFYNYQLPFSKRNTDIVKRIIVLSNQNGTVLSGKTGSGMKDNNMVNGWFVGYVEKNQNVYFFATNIEAAKNASGWTAKEITLKILKDMGLN